MSEHQYYEFQAIDRRLTPREIATLRGYSTRATITPTSFGNDYSWGNFKGDPLGWMKRYFDAFLYVANWGTRELMLRVPIASIPVRTARRYLQAPVAAVHVTRSHLILSFTSEDEGGDFTDEFQGMLAALLPLRSEIAGGDVRALYLAWLAAVQTDLVDPEEKEPPCPPGLRELTPALEALVDFLRLDRDLLGDAAEASPKLPSSDSGAGLRRWIRQLSDKQKTDLLARVAGGEEAQVRAELGRRYRASRPLPKSSGPIERRRVREIRAAEATE